MLPVSVLDLSPVGIGSSTAESFHNSVVLAQNAESLGYKRIWFAEHHNMPGIASAATSVLLCHIGNHTQRIRIGAGGIMLPNHAPLAIAEQFGTLNTLFGDRVDLGLGRAPGSDPTTIRAMRRHHHLHEEEHFADEVVDMLNYFDDPGHSHVQAIPGVGTHVPVWILGSSTYGANLAAHLGLPYAFASHFSPQLLPQALYLYRQNFKPSKHLAKPYAMLAVNVIIADSHEEAQYHFSSLQQAFLNTRRGIHTQIPKPVENIQAIWSESEKLSVMHSLACSFVGTAETVQMQLDHFRKEYQPDELIITQLIHDQNIRLNTLRQFKTLHLDSKS